jgi:hypothetical protein
MGVGGFASRGRGTGGGGSAGGRISGMGGVSMSQHAQAGGAGASGSAVGGLFRYDVAGPVTVPDRSSTLVSLVNKKIAGEDLLLYRPDAGGAAAKHPYRAVRFTNDTGYMLQGGPVTVLARGTFVGEGIFDRIEDGAETFLPFSLEQGVSITKRMKSEDKPLRLLAISNGHIRCETQRRRTHNLTVYRRVKDAPDRLYVRIPKRGGFTLEKPPKDTKSLGDSWYVPVSVEVGENKVAITEVKAVRRRVRWQSGLGRSMLSLYLNDAKADSKVAEAARLVGESIKILAEKREALTRLRSKLRTQERDQERLRRSIRTLGEAKVNKKLAREFSKRLADSERKIAKISAETVALEDAIHQHQKRVEVMIQGVKLGDD